MGGINSGRRRTSSRGVVESAISLDMRALRRLELVRPGECVIDTLRWSTGDLVAPEARVRIDLSDPAPTLTITRDTYNGTTKQRVAIDVVPCRFGGHRFYFLCPDGGGRCEVLYLVAGRFASRKAHGLAYATQTIDELGRARRRIRKLRARLNGVGLSPQPRGRKRYKIAERLRAAVHEERALRTERLRRVVDGGSHKRSRRRSGTH